MRDLLKIDPKDSTPIWKQIESGLRSAISSRSLSAGHPVPTVRELARDLRINPATVSKVYQQLVQQGVLVAREGAGIFVSDEAHSILRTSLQQPIREGVKLGPYEILGQIGVGGMGEVWKARDARLDRLVAVKVLSSVLVQDADALARFTREAKAVAALSHPNVMAIFDIGETSGVPYFVMELLEGGNLRQRMVDGPLQYHEAVGLAVQMADGLAAAHSKGIIHRDLKPENLWATKEGWVKILDFGLAKRIQYVGDRDVPRLGAWAHSPQPNVTEAGTVFGTLGYMSPEQACGEVLGPASDVFSLGTVIFEMVSGQRAFNRDTPSESLRILFEEDPLARDALPSDLPPEFINFLGRSLQKDPTRRLSDMMEVVKILEGLLEPGSRSPSGPRQAFTNPRPSRMAATDPISAPPTTHPEETTPIQPLDPGGKQLDPFRPQAARVTIPHE